MAGDLVVEDASRRHANFKVHSEYGPAYLVKQGIDPLPFYDPPGDSRWMVHHPGERHPVSVGPEHRVPNGADPNQTMVYFTRGGQSSAPVSLRQIQDGQGMHASNKQQP